MNERKATVIVLAEDAAVELGESFSMFIRSNDNNDYINAKAVEIDEQYFHLTIDHEMEPGAKVELVPAVPHEFVKGTISGAEADMTELGFS